MSALSASASTAAIHCVISATATPSAAVNEPLQTFELPARAVQVRFLREDDCSALEWHGGPDLRSFYEEQWHAHRSDEICVLVAGLNDFPIAQIAVHWRGKPTHPHIPDLQSFRVFAAFRGMGIGSHLMRAAERLVAERGFTQISLAVGLENTRARALYERAGYGAIGQPYDDVWHYTDARGHTQQVVEHVIDMVKPLSQF